MGRQVARELVYWWLFLLLRLGGPFRVFVLFVVHLGMRDVHILCRCLGFPRGGGWSCVTLLRSCHVVFRLDGCCAVWLLEIILDQGRYLGCVSGQMSVSCVGW